MRFDGRVEAAAGGIQPLSRRWWRAGVMPAVVYSARRRVRRAGGWRGPHRVLLLRERAEAGSSEELGLATIPRGAVFQSVRRVQEQSTSLVLRPLERADCQRCVDGGNRMCHMLALLGY